jgi:hypothetical protein
MPLETLLPREFPGGRLRRLRPADLQAFQAYRTRNAPSVRLLERLEFSLWESRDVIFRGEACRELVYVLSRGRPGARQ